jgi:membrane protein DedA with SNARE-associated domain
MPFGQFILYSAAGSLIWNSLLVTLGVAAGDFIQENLRYFDYLVAAVVVLGGGYLVYKRVQDRRSHRRRRTTAGRAEDADGA